MKNNNTATLKIHRKKAILQTSSEEAIPIKIENLHGALHEDFVTFSFIKKNNKSYPKVIKILKRHKKTFVGTIESYKENAFFLADDRKVHTNFFISKKDLKGAKDSDKVLVALKKETAQKNKNPQAKVLKIIGKKGTHQTEIHSILENYELPYSFSPKILKATQNLNAKITTSEIKKRKDFRNIVTFTIDPEDAKDFDDALSFEVLENGNYSIGVHIADVSHYVKENSILDKEAYERATSIYLVDRVVPMLPEMLSNDICSLKPCEEKLTFSAVFEINEKAQILKTWLGKTIIYSDKRLTYEQAQNIIENNSNFPENIQKAVLKLNELAQKIRKQRMQKGAISFDKTEIKFKLDAENNPLEIHTKTSKNAHKLIEEFMLLANKKVAAWIGKKIKKTLIYRIHDFPDSEKLQELKNFVRKFKYRFSIDSQKNIAKNINQLLEDSKNTPEANIIQTLTIRCMSKAIYSTQNIGHYGLAFDFYTHFTSPIRRYCDLVVHRLLEHYLKKSYKISKDYAKKSKHISDREVLAIKAERDSQKYMQIKYMQHQENKIFEGMISGLTDWGMYVEIVKNKCEGMILLKDIKNDHYIFDKPNNIIKGRSTKKKYQLGDMIFIKLKKADLEKKHLDFYLVEKP